MGCSPERGETGKGKRERGHSYGEGGEGAMGRGRFTGGGCAMGLGPAAPLFGPAACVLCCLWGRRRKERRKRKGRKRKETNMENFLNLKIFREKNKRQFMKLVKIIFF
jgi:hypothetical protein